MSSGKAEIIRAIFAAYRAHDRAAVERFFADDFHPTSIFRGSPKSNCAVITADTITSPARGEPLLFALHSQLDWIYKVSP